MSNIYDISAGFLCDIYNRTDPKRTELCAEWSVDKGLEP